MERTWREKIEGTTDQILAQIKRLLDEGNIRRVVVKQQGKVIAEFPLTVGVVGTVLAPVAAAHRRPDGRARRLLHRSREDDTSRGGIGRGRRRGNGRARRRATGRVARILVLRDADHGSRDADYADLSAEDGTRITRISMVTGAHQADLRSG